MTKAPTLPHCVWSLPPKGARFALGRPGGETGFPFIILVDQEAP